MEEKSSEESQEEARRPTCALPPPGTKDSKSKMSRKATVIQCLQDAGRSDLALEFAGRSYGLTGDQFMRMIREYVVIEGEGS